MQNRIFLKSALVWLFVLLVASCSSNPEKKVDDSVSASASHTAPSKDSPSPWQRAYNEPLDSSPNQLAHKPNKSASSVEPITDVWQRIRNGFTISDYEQLEPDSEKQLHWFVEHPDYVNRVVERARPYLYFIVEEVEKRGMPMEVALLPVVESGFKPHAYSKSHAAGLWQFIPGTGKVYGLKQNWWYDGRRDVIQSTRAALDYLQKLHNDFGDWQLAFAAYNCGEGTVGRAIKRNEKNGRPTDFWSLDLPAETSAYVPKLMAVSHMVKFPERYELSLSPINNKPYLSIVDTGSQIDLDMAAKMAGIKNDEIYQLNPGFNRWATAPDGPHQLVLPLDKAEKFKQALASLPAKDRVQWARHQIQRGESLSVIARRYDTTVAVIKQANELRSNQIRAGRHLLIPVASHDSGKLLRTAGQSVKMAPQAQKSYYIVRPGDTWWDISRKYNMDVNTLAKWNKQGSHDILRPGQKLLVLSEKAQRKSVNYTIKNGDSLWAISRKFNVSVADVRDWNGLSDRSLLQPGQNLTLYLDET